MDSANRSTSKLLNNNREVSNGPPKLQTINESSEKLTFLEQIIELDNNQGKTINKDSNKTESTTKADTESNSNTNTSLSVDEKKSTCDLELQNGDKPVLNDSGNESKSPINSCSNSPKANKSTKIICETPKEQQHNEEEPVKKGDSDSPNKSLSKPIEIDKEPSRMQKASEPELLPNLTEKVSSAQEIKEPLPFENEPVSKHNISMEKQQEINVSHQSDTSEKISLNLSVSPLKFEGTKQKTLETSDENDVIVEIMDTDTDPVSLEQSKPSGNTLDLEDPANNTISDTDPKEPAVSTADLKEAESCNQKKSTDSITLDPIKEMISVSCDSPLSENLGVDILPASPIIGDDHSKESTDIGQLQDNIKSNEGDDSEEIKSMSTVNLISDEENAMEVDFINVQQDEPINPLPLTNGIDSESNLNEKVMNLLKQVPDDASDLSATDYLDDIAEECEEESPYDSSNDIIDEGESVGSTTSQFDSDESYDNSSFIDDEEQSLLSGNEYDLDDADIKGMKKTRKRIQVIIESSSENDQDAVVISDPTVQSKTSSTILNDKSIIDIEVIEEVKNKSVASENNTEKLVGKKTEFENKIKESEDRLAVFEDNLTESENKLTEAKDKLKESESNLAKMKDMLTDSDDESSETEDNLTEFQDKLAEFQDKLTEAEDQLSKSYDKLVELRQKPTESDEKLAESTEKIAQVEDKSAEIQEKPTESEMQDLIPCGISVDSAPQNLSQHNENIVEENDIILKNKMMEKSTNTTQNVVEVPERRLHLEIKENISDRDVPIQSINKCIRGITRSIRRKLNEENIKQLDSIAVNVIIGIKGDLASETDDKGNLEQNNQQPAKKRKRSHPVEEDEEDHDLTPKKTKISHKKLDNESITTETPLRKRKHTKKSKGNEQQTQNLKENELLPLKAKRSKDSTGPKVQPTSTDKTLDTDLTSDKKLKKKSKPKNKIDLQPSSEGAMGGSWDWSVLEELPKTSSILDTNQKLVANEKQKKKVSKTNKKSQPSSQGAAGGLWNWSVIESSKPSASPLNKDHKIKANLGNDKQGKKSQKRKRLEPSSQGAVGSWDCSVLAESLSPSTTASRLAPHKDMFKKNFKNSVLYDQKWVNRKDTNTLLNDKRKKM